jgi:hypothetical protein
MLSFSPTQKSTRKTTRKRQAGYGIRPQKRLCLEPLEDRTVPSYSFATIDFPGASYTDALGNNDAGQIVGSYVKDGVGRGYLLSGGVYTTIDPPGSLGSDAAVGINNGGQIVGIWGIDGVRDYGYLLDSGMYTIINPPGSVENGANKINASGQIAGGFSTGGFLIGQHGFVYSSGAYTILDVPGATDTAASGINDSGQVVGMYRTDARHGFLMSGGTYTLFDVPGSTSTQGTSINNSGQIVGIYDSAHGYLRSGGTYTTIDVPGAIYTEADSINNLGQIVGTYQDASGGWHGFVATNDDVTSPSITTAIGGVFTYNGAPHAGSGSVNVSGGDVELTYVGINGTTYSSTTAPTNAGTYTVIAAYAGDATHTGSTDSAALTIKPKLLEASAWSQGTINIGSNGLIVLHLSVDSGQLYNSDSVASLFNGAAFTIKVQKADGSVTYGTLTSTAKVESDGSIAVAMQMNNALRAELYDAYLNGRAVNFDMTATANGGNYSIDEDTMSRLLNNGALRYVV